MYIIIISIIIILYYILLYYIMDFWNFRYKDSLRSETAEFGMDVTNHWSQPLRQRRCSHPTVLLGWC